MRNLLFVLILLLTSCKALRNVSKDVSRNEKANTETRITVRPSDTLYFTVPKVRYKDTTIVTVSEKNTVLRTRFNERGQVERIECIPAEILEYLALTNQEKNMQRIKDTEMQVRTLDWFYIGAIVAIFLLLLIKLPRLK